MVSVTRHFCVGLAALLVTACAATTRPPTPPKATAAQTDDSSEDGDVTDSDGEAEADDRAPGEIAIDVGSARDGACPKNMVLAEAGEARFCIDKYEASLVEIDADGTEKAFAHWLPVDGHTVRAVSEPGVFPQGFISEVQAEDACAASNKRLCSHVEWKTACMGPAKTTFPYGEARRPGVCHDTGKSAVAAVFGYQRLADPTNVPARTAASASASAPATKSPSSSDRKAHASVKGRAAETSHSRPARPEAKSASASVKSNKKKTKHGSRSSSVASSSAAAAPNQSKRAPAKTSSRPASVEPSVWSQLNDPRLGQTDGGLARTGSHAECVNGFGVVDMVGNLHEWVKTDASTVHGTFAGGYYLDTSLNGDGCQYRTVAHAHDYHDYSTGFRCCAEPKKSR